jgi:two-component system, NtrC family, sensor kinase
MRIALKLLSSLAVLTLIVLASSAYYEQRERTRILAMDIEAEGRMAKTLRAVLIKICDLAGPPAAKEVIETMNRKTPREVRWLEPNEVPRMPGRDLPAEVNANMVTGEPVWVQWPNDKGESIRYLYLPVMHYGQPLAVIEASELMTPRTEFVERARVHSMAVGIIVVALSGALAVVLGRWLIGQPIAALTRSVRALGNGEYVPPAIGPRRDELGTLASELKTLGERLAERERLRHDDRLRTVGQLASGVAHELGTPLSVIGVRSRLIASGEATGAEAVANASAILEQTERMTRLVRQLLDYSRRTAAQAATIDLRKAAIQAVEMLEPLARAQGVTIEAESESSGVVVRGDGSQLQQVLTNLILNGVQAMPAGGRVEVRCGRGPAAPLGKSGRPVDRCWLRVTDTGMGISPEDVARVFEPFFTTKPVGEGTGLGLAVAQAIVEEHGGWIAVQSEPGRGTAFTVYLPPSPDVADERLAS